MATLLAKRVPLMTITLGKKVSTKVDARHLPSRRTVAEERGVRKSRTGADLAHLGYGP